MSALPVGWVETTLGEVASDIVGGGTPSKSHATYFDGAIPFMTVKDMNTRYPVDTKDKITQDALANSSARMIPAGTNVIATRMGLGKAVRPTIDVAINQDLKAIFVNDAMTEDFLHWKLIESAEYLVGLGTGTTVMGIRLEDVRSLSVPLPPLPEQQRIVAKVDGLMTRTARARKDLAAIPILITRYKQRLLALAFSGDLTANWRADEAEIESSNLSITEIDGRASALGIIPQSWSWTSFGEVAGVTGGLTKNGSRDSISNRVPYLRVANVYANELRLSDVSEIGCTEAELEKTRLLKGDLLIVEGNGSIEQVGRVALWNDEVADCSHQNHIIRARSKRLLLPSYGLYWLLSPQGREAIERVASSSSGLHTLSITKVKGFPIPMCGKAEQAEIVRRIETAFAWLDRLAAEQAAATKLLPKLDAAILTKAFAGHLVPQNPTDEPASVLLARVKAERAELPIKGKGRKKAA